MKSYRKYGKRIVAVAIAAAMGFSSVPEAASALAIPQTARSRQQWAALGRKGAGADPVRKDGGVDISKYGYKLEGEYCNTTGDFALWNIETKTEGDTTYLEYAKKSWGNAKWTVYIDKPGKYTVSARMQTDEDAAFEFSFGSVLNNGEIASPIQVVAKAAKSDAYKDVNVGSDGQELELTVQEAGIYYVKLMDNGGEQGQLSAKLDYLQFTCKEEFKPEETAKPSKEEQAKLDAAKKIYQDASKTTEERIDALLGVMTLSEKAAQMVQAEQGNGGAGTKGNRPATAELVKETGLGSVFSGGGSKPPTGNSAQDWADRVNEFKAAAKESRLGIPLIYGVDAVHGNNNVDNAVIFPHNIGLGAANDAGLAEKVGKAAAEEIKATGIRWSFAPTLGIPDSERWGRFYECFGEDVDIVSAMGAAYVKGFLSCGVMGSAKHYIGEGQTTNGANQGDIATENFDQLMQEKRLLEPYKAAIEAGAYTVMASYNSVNGEKCHANKHLLTDVLKGSTANGGLGFKGFVVSDYNGVDQLPDKEYSDKVVSSVNAGVDMLMEPYDWETSIDAIKEGVENHKITEERVNDAVRRILWVKFEMGLFEEEVASTDEKALLEKFGKEEHRAVAKEAAEKTLTVLKNDKVDKAGKTALDLLDDADKKIVVSGDKANDIGAQCGGWTISWQGGLDLNNSGSNVNASGGNKVTEGTTVWEGFKEKAKDNASYNARGTVAKGTDVAVVVVGEEPYAESNGDKTASDLTLPDDDLHVMDQVLKTKGDTPAVLVLMTGRPVAIADYVDEFDAIVEAWLPGSEGDAIADVMLDDGKDFTATCPVTWTWYPEYLTEKSDAGKVLFPRGTGLKKDGTSIVSGGQTAIPAANERPAVPEKPAKPQIPTYQEAIDIDANGNILEGEWCGSNSYNISTGSEVVNGENTGYMEWTKKDWGNGKWLVYFRQAGTYDVTLKMKVTEPEEGDFTNFKFGIYEEGDPNPDMVIPSKGKTDGYEDFVITGLEVPSTGKWNVKIMDSNNEVSAKLDYIKFDLKTPKGDKDTGTEDDGQDPTDETPLKSNGTVIQKDAVKVWMTSTENAQNQSWYKYPTEMKNQLTEKAALDITSVDNQDITTINVNPNTTYQTFLGMGTSLEEATVNNLNQLDKDVKQKFIEDLVNPQKGGMSLFRLTIGTSDFTSQRFYTYYDIKNIDERLSAGFKPNWNPKDGEEGFSIQKDRDCGIIDTIKMVQEAARKFGVENEVKFFASSWTPPGWMKNKDSKTDPDGKNAKEGEGERLRGGTLNDEYIDDLATYYLRFVEEYAKEGIPVYGMTLQNEPGDDFNYPSCRITGAQESKLAIEMKKQIAASTVLSTEQKQVKLWAFDHNCSIAEDYVKSMATVEGGLDAVDGIAFHDYSGDMKIMQEIYDKYLNQGTKKNQTVNLTERSVWGTTGANSIVTYLRNNAISYNSWVTMLDSNHGIHQWPGQPDPTMFARAVGSSTEYWAMPEFYITGQFSRFIRPGYVRVASDEGTTATIRNVVFKNPKTGEYVAVVVNASKRKQNFKFVSGGTQFIGAVPAGNIATYVWNAKENPVDNPKVISAKKITLNTNKLCIVKGKSVTVKAMMDPFNTTDKITWSTSKKSVAIVKNGKITAKKAGTAKITAKTTSGKIATCIVKVVKNTKKAKSITLEKKVTVKKGAWVLLKPSLKPANSTDIIKWKSSKKSVATVDKYGFVKGKKKGKTTITATTGSGKKVKCIVTVK